MPISRAWFRTALGVWVLGLVAYFVPPATWSPVSRFLLTHEIVTGHGISIDRYADATGDRALRDGRWFSDKAPLPSLMAAGPYWLFHAGDTARGGTLRYAAVSSPDLPAARVLVNRSFARGLYVCSVATAGVATALMAVLLFELLARRFGEEAGLFGSVAAVLGTPVFAYGTSFYGHTIAACLVTAGIFALFADPEARDPPGTGSIIVAGACLAASAGCEYVVAGPVLAVVAVALATWPRRTWLRLLAALALGALGPVVLVAGYQWLAFGAPWRTGYSFIARPEFAAGHAHGLLGIHLPKPDVIARLLAGKRRGLFYVAPVAALGVAVATYVAVKRRDPALRACLLAFVALLLLNSGYYMWWGGAATGPRHLVPVLGVVGFGIAAAARVRRMPLLITALLMLSIFNMLVFAGVGIEAPEHGDALFGYAYARFFAGHVATMSGASNLGVDMGWLRGATLGPPLAWVIIGGHWLWQTARSRQASLAPS